LSDSRDLWTFCHAERRKEVTVTKTTKTTGWCSNTLHMNCLYKYRVCKHIHCDTRMWSVLHSLFWIQGVPVSGTNIRAGDQSSVVHTWPSEKLSDIKLYIFEENVQKILQRVEKIRKYSTKHVFLNFIFRNLNSDVAADGRSHCPFKSPTLEPNGKSFVFRPQLNMSYPFGQLRLNKKLFATTVKCLEAECCLSEDRTC
jgi:hypothetical protein